MLFLENAEAKPVWFVPTEFLGKLTAEAARRDARASGFHQSRKARAPKAAPSGTRGISHPFTGSEAAAGTEAFPAQRRTGDSGGLRRGRQPAHGPSPVASPRSGKRVRARWGQGGAGSGSGRPLGPRGRRRLRGEAPGERGSRRHASGPLSPAEARGGRPELRSRGRLNPTLGPFPHVPRREGGRGGGGEEAREGASVPPPLTGHGSARRPHPPRPGSSLPELGGPGARVRAAACPERRARPGRRGERGPRRDLFKTNSYAAFKTPGWFLDPVSQRFPHPPVLLSQPEGAAQEGAGGGLTPSPKRC